MARDVSVKNRPAQDTARRRPAGRTQSENREVRKTAAGRQPGRGDSSGRKTSGQYTERELQRIRQREKEDNRQLLKLRAVLLLLLVLFALLAFAAYYFVWRSHDYDLDLPFDPFRPVYGYSQGIDEGGTSALMAEDLCVSAGDQNVTARSLEAYSAGLFDINSAEVMYAKDMFAKRSPASITKLMTALLTIRYGNLDEIITVTPVVKDIEYGSSVCDIHEGDVLTLRQLLYGMMVASGNDAAMMIAEHLGGGSVSAFVDMMNAEAKRIGATSTHFMNPHGLTDPDHYSTVYDIYLIFQEAMKYDVFQDIINRHNYYAEYKRGDGSGAAVTWESTNYYFTGEADAPEEISVFGGKTGTTEDAGACLSLLAKDVYGNPYIAVVLHSTSKETLYPDMNQLLTLINS